jgi:hypothetical protein
VGGERRERERERRNERGQWVAYQIRRFALNIHELRHFPAAINNLTDGLLVDLNEKKGWVTIKIDGHAESS